MAFLGLAVVVAVFLFATVTSCVAGATTFGCVDLTTDYNQLLDQSVYRGTPASQTISVNISLPRRSERCWAIYSTDADAVVGVYVTSLPAVGNTSLHSEAPLTRDCHTSGSSLSIVDVEVEVEMYEVCADAHDGPGPFYSLGASLKLSFSTGDNADSTTFVIYKQTKSEVDHTYFHQWYHAFGMNLITWVTVGSAGTVVILLGVWVLMRYVERRRLWAKYLEEQELREKKQKNRKGHKVAPNTTHAHHSNASSSAA